MLHNVCGHHSRSSSNLYFIIVIFNSLKNKDLSIQNAECIYVNFNIYMHASTITFADISVHCIISTVSKRITMKRPILLSACLFVFSRLHSVPCECRRVRDGKPANCAKQWAALQWHPTLQIAEAGEGWIGTEWEWGSKRKGKQHLTQVFLITFTLGQHLHKSLAEPESLLNLNGAIVIYFFPSLLDNEINMFFPDFWQQKEQCFNKANGDLYYRFFFRCIFSLNFWKPALYIANRI